MGAIEATNGEDRLYGGLVPLHVALRPGSLPPFLDCKRTRIPVNRFGDEVGDHLFVVKFVDYADSLGGVAVVVEVVVGGQDRGDDYLFCRVNVLAGGFLEEAYAVSGF